MNTRHMSKLAFGAAMVLVLVSCGGDANREPTTSTTVAVTTTQTPTTAQTPATTAQAPTTTVAPEPAGPIEDPSQAGELIEAAFASQDLGAIKELMADDVRISAGPFQPSLEGFTEYMWHLNATRDVANCEPSGGPGMVTVTCDLVATDDFFRADGIEFTGGSLTYVVRDGYIISLAESMFGPAETETFDSFIGGFLDYLVANHPDAFGRTVDPAIGQIFTAEAAQVYLDYVNEWLASRG